MKVAYAASANTVNLDDLKQHQRDQLKTDLSAYDHISVRDSHTEELLENLNINSVHRVPDPTILTDIPTGDAATILQKNGIDLDKPILGFHGLNNPVFKDICEYYQNKGYQIVASTTSPDADVELRGKVDPFEYYTMYDYYDMVVTSSLHSTIFSIKNGTPFATIDVDSTYATLESKTHSLLQEFSLLERHIDAINGDATKFYDRINKLEQPLKENQIQKHISRLRKIGFEYLEMVREDYETNY
jgi:polysaccharide pyruvyl transferase WcaK-like protein